MSRKQDFADYVLELMNEQGRYRARPMFGGYGIYRDDLMIAIVSDNRLYFKADAQSCGEFERRGLQPFSYSSRGRMVALKYYEAPPDVFDDPDSMNEWAQRAHQAALRAKH